MGRPARRSRGRAVNGILVLDKPVGMGSNEALQRVKRLYRARKAGHTGSLDRLASGLLPICFGEATKLSGHLLNADKHYVATFVLGVTTTTGDAEGDVVSRRDGTGAVRGGRRPRASPRFRGEIEQIPPMHSALKHKGRRLYQLAHEGIVVERQPRRVTIHRFDVLRVDRETDRGRGHCARRERISALWPRTSGGVSAAARASRRCAGSGPAPSPPATWWSSRPSSRWPGRPASPRRAAAADGGGGLRDGRACGCPKGSRSTLRKGQPVQVPHSPTEGWVRIHTERAGFIGVGEVLGRRADRAAAALRPGLTINSLFVKRLLVG